MKYAHKKAVRETLLALARERWPGDPPKMRRVADSVYDQLDAAMFNWMKDFINRHPTKGHTLK